MGLHWLRRRTDRRRWAIRAVPRGQLAYLFAVDAVTLAWLVGVLLDAGSMRSRDWWVLALMAAIAVGFEEAANRVARLRLRLRLSADLRCDMAPLWAVAGAIAMPSAGAVLLLGAVLLHGWFTEQRRAGQALHRATFNGAVELLGCLAAGYALRHWSDSSWSDLRWQLAAAVPVAVAILGYSVVKRLLVALGLAGAGIRGRALAGSRDENLIDLATLCLGGLTGFAAIDAPWLCLLVISPMVTLQRGALMRELEAAATVDAKTGLLNAVAWEHLAKRELARANRAGRSLGVLILDLDHFKLVNDRYGHLVGDRVLRRIACTLQTAVREFDGVGRFGGEEFVIVLPEVSDRDALLIAERVRARINELRPGSEADVLAVDDEDPMSVSVGVACAPTDGVELADLLVAADSALYVAKASGRNCVVLADRKSGEPLGRVGGH